jgi:hypothetical protein
MNIEFKHSSSPRFRFVLEESRQHQSFIKEGNLYSVTVDREAAYRLAKLLKGFRNKRVFIDNKELPWDEVFAYLDCYTLRSTAYDPVHHCQGDSRQFPAFNLWRCIHTMMPLTEAEWLCYGYFDIDGTFIFDKEKIKHYLLTNTKKIRFCPAFHENIMLLILDAFPETANPRIDHDWKYMAPRPRDIKIEVSTDEQPNTYVGVAPASPEAIKNIHEKILEKFY